QLLTTSDIQNLNFILQQDIFDIGKVVVTGIASERSIGNTEVSVSRVDASELSETNSFSDMSQLLYGKVSGVDIRKSSGNVGGGWRFDVRAGGGLNGSEQPVIYLDGIRIDNVEYSNSYTGGQGFSTLADLNPEDIESIEVLKGPAGATSYGTNGSNGVVIITTKKGQGIDRKDGRNFTMKYKRIQGTNKPSYKFSTDQDGYYSAEDINAVLTPGDINQQYFSIFGGNSSLNYFISFDDRYEEGITIEKDNNYMDRKTARLNLDIMAAKNLTISVSSNYIYNKMTMPMNDNNLYGWMANTIYSPAWTDHQPYFFTDSVSIASVKYSALSKRFLGSIGWTYRPFSDSKLLNGFKLTGRIGIDDSHIKENATYRPDLFYPTIPAGSRYSSVRQNQEISYEMGISFRYKTGSLNTNTSLTTQAFDRRNSMLGLEKQNFITPAISNIGAGEELTYGDENFFHARDGGTVITEEISFMDQYFLTLSNRSDYGSMIGSKAAEVNYTGYRFGWRADQTLSAFMPSFITMLKPRYAYGESGVLPGLRDNIELLWSAEPGGAGVGGVLSEIGNPTIEPERISETEIGFDTEMVLPMNLGALSIEFTSYTQEASNSLVGKLNSPSTGLTESEEPVNVGKMEMDGTELLLKYSTDIGALIGFPHLLSTDISYGISKNNNKVISMDDGDFEAQPIYDQFDLQVIQPGLPKYAFYNFMVLGASFDSETGLYAGVQLDTVTN
nr:TonB-dependent receptor plug domain-containing protein [Candidatus Neomarinimicrobiota bacterium]